MVQLHDSKWKYIYWLQTVYTDSYGPELEQLGHQARSPGSALFSPLCFGEGSPTKIDRTSGYRLLLTSKAGGPKDITLAKLLMACPFGPFPTKIDYRKKGCPVSHVVFHPSQALRCFHRLLRGAVSAPRSDAIRFRRVGRVSTGTYFPFAG